MELEPTADSSPLHVVVRIEDGRAFTYNAASLTLGRGDQVIVPTDQGIALGTVVLAPVSVEESAQPRRVIRRAEPEDFARDDANHLRARDALRTCLQRVQELRLPMKLIKADRLFDGSKIVFYFAAPGRVDFRQLVRDLAHALHTRIEMKQIGARDETKLIGGVGPCGRELCCSSFLRDFGAVSVKMAKEQGLSPNPSKLAGMCGRLKCCLRYEYDTYVELGRALPEIGRHVVSVKGDGTVVRRHILKQTVLLRLDAGGEAEATLEDLVQKKPD